MIYRFLTAITLILLSSCAQSQTSNNNRGYVISQTQIENETVPLD